MRARVGLCAASMLAAASLLSAQAPVPPPPSDKVIDVRSVRPPAGNTFEALWETYRRADDAGDTETAEKTFKEIRRLRTERNAESLEELALGLVGRGQDHVAKGDHAHAESDFGNAIGLDPHLPDAYFSRAGLDVRKGPVGILTAVRDTFGGLTARLPTSRGQYLGLLLVVPVLLLTLFLTVAAFSGALLVRSGRLLRHDLEERFGEGSLAFGVWIVLLLLPCITFQGIGWLPLWWLVLLFVYLSRVEQGIVLAVMLLALAIGPGVRLLDDRIRAEKNPLFRASVQSIEGGADSRSREILERAVGQFPDDRDLVYLLGLQYKKGGRYDDAAGLYRDILKNDAGDRIALNNLANLEFARGEFAPAIARYKQGAEESPTQEITATFFYNLSLAHLQRFEYQPAGEARSQAERLAGGLVRSYDGLWKYDNGNYAVVDLALTPDEAWAKFLGTASGPGRKNVAGRGLVAFDTSRLAEEAANRFAGFLGVFVVVVFLLQRWRGKKMFTMRCDKCGTPFCKLCHLGAVSGGGLCTQCYHLFVVRDGVSGPARNQKLLEVQKEDERRERIFRTLSLLSPGAGHCYAQKPLLGVALAFVWYGTLALVLLAGRVLPVTEAPSTQTGPWGLGLAALVLIATYVVANRARPDFEFVLPAPRSRRRF